MLQAQQRQSRSAAEPAVRIRLAVRVKQLRRRRDVAGRCGRDHGVVPSSNVYQPARVALRVRRTRLTPTTQRSRRAGATNRAYAPSGAHTPLIHVVPAATPSTTSTMPAVKPEFEISVARQSPKAPAIISIARGNAIRTPS